MKRVFLLLLLLPEILLSQQGGRKVLGEAGKRYSVNDTYVLENDSGLITSRAVYGDLANPYDTRGKFLNLARKLLAGSNMAGTSLTRGKVRLRIASFGDSMGGYIFMPFSEKLISMFGYGGGVMASIIPAGGAYVHADVSETNYWFNGNWQGINGSGSLTYLYGGGRAISTQLKIYYIKEPGAGSFQVQLDPGTGYADEGSVVSCGSTQLESGVVTINKPQGAYGLRINQVSGNIRIIMCVAINEPADFDGVTVLNLSNGGLAWDKANQTSKAITRPVFEDLGIDLATLQFKENGTVYNDIRQWTDSFAAASRRTDWVLIGSGPQVSADEANIADNLALKKVALDRNWFYFDGYRPLINYAKVDSLDWEGDGVHLNHATGFYLSSMLWRIIGIEDFLKFGRMAGTDPTGDMNFTLSRGIKFTGSNTNVPAGRIAASTNSPDMYIYSARWFVLLNNSGTMLSHFDPNSGWVIDNLHNSRGYTFNLPNSPGLFLPNDTTFGFFLHRGAGTRGNLVAQDISSGRSFFAPNTQAYSSGGFTYLVKNSSNGRLEYLTTLSGVTAAAGDSSLSLATTGFVDKIKDSLTSSYQSGTYVPSVVQSPNYTGNVSSVTANASYWQKIGNVVRVNASFSVVSVAASSVTAIQLSLPRPSAFTSASDVNGVAQWQPDDFSGLNGVLSGDIVNDKVDIVFKTPAGTPSNAVWKVMAQFSYIIK